MRVFPVVFAAPLLLVDELDIANRKGRDNLELISPCAVLLYAVGVTVGFSGFMEPSRR